MITVQFISSLGFVSCNCILMFYDLYRSPHHYYHHHHHHYYYYCCCCWWCYCCYCCLCSGSSSCCYCHYDIIIFIFRLDPVTNLEKSWMTHKYLNFDFLLGYYHDYWRRTHYLMNNHGVWFNPLHADVVCGRQTKFSNCFQKKIEIQMFITIFGFSIKMH